MVPFTKKADAGGLIMEKIYTRESILKRIHLTRFLNRTIVFTNGCFDILHRGHIDYLCKASNLGDELFIGLNSDASVRAQKKGDSRPLQDEKSRAMIMASLQFVNGVIIFDEENPIDLIKLIKPDFLVKGADYDENEKDPHNRKYIVGSDFVIANGGIVKTIPFMEGYSTSAIEKKIKG